MFLTFTGIILVFTTLYPSLAIGGNECLWCNKATARNYVACLITKLKGHSQFGIRPDILDDMKLSILAASQALTNTPDDMRTKIMNGGLAGEMSGLIISLAGSSNQNADIMIAQATKLAGECYTSITGLQHSIFSDNLGRMIIDMMDDSEPNNSYDSAPNGDYDVGPSDDYISEPNNAYNIGPDSDYSYQAPSEDKQPLLPFNKPVSFLPENREQVQTLPLPVPAFSQPQYFQGAQPAFPSVIENVPSSGAFSRPFQSPPAQESVQYFPRQDQTQVFQERPNQPSPIAPPPVLENG
ncbi:hypothetical protein NPIL_73281, partial [Nephila pilipes]